MNAPATLLDLAGFDRTPAKWDEATLILIDHQNEYVSGALPLTGIAEAITECNKLLALARAHNTPVVHVVHHSPAGAPVFNPESTLSHIITELSPKDGEHTIIKTLPNSFAHTNLAELLAKLGHKHLIIAGFQTHMCVSATVRSALDHGYQSTVVAAACATRNLPNPLNNQPLIASEIHQVALAELHDRFATVVADASIWKK